MPDHVDILLATYQGARYIKDQLTSILNQTYPHFHIWIRDDGSSDETLSIIQQFAIRHPHQVSSIPSDKNLGVKGNFSTLMQHSQAQYVMFADQDDIWLPHKIKSSLCLMKKLENHHGTHLPLLIHTDLKVVRSDLSEISPSFWNYAGLNPSATSLNRLVVQNVLTGCTMLMNHPLVELALPIPPEALMHDWWIALVAAAFGHIDHVPAATLLYRQHDSNDTGAKKYSFRQRDRNCCVYQTYQQARLFLERYQGLLHAKKQEIVAAYSSLGQLSYLQQKRHILKFKFFKHGFLRNLRQLISY